MFSLILLLLYMCGSSFAAQDGSSIKNVKVCLSFDKSHKSHLVITWDGPGVEVEIVYNTTGRKETSVKYESKSRMISALEVSNATIGNNLTVQVHDVNGSNPTVQKNKNNPITIVVNYLHNVKWTRLSANHIQFNCTLACRSNIRSCVVELNETKNRSLNVTKTDFSTWAVVDFYSLDADQAFPFTVYAQDGGNNTVGEPINGIIPPLSTVVEHTISPTTKSEATTTVLKLATSSLQVTTASSVSTKGKILSTTATSTTTATPIDQTGAKEKEDKNNNSTGLMIGVIITSVLVVLLAFLLLLVGLFLWRQRKGRTSEVSSKHITDPKHDVQNTSLHGNGQKNIKDKNVIAINAYEEIVEVPVYSKPLSTSNPMFLQTGRVKHSSISSKKSVSSQKSFENLRGSLSPRVFDEKGDNNKNFETESSIKETHDHSSNENVIDQYSGSNKLQMSFTENSDQESPTKTENDTEEKENPYFELVNLATTNCYENATILPLNKQTSKSKDYIKENRDLEKVCSKCQTLPIQGLRNSKSLPLDDPITKRRSLNDYDEPVKVDQVIDPTTGHTYTLPILRRKE